MNANKAIENLVIALGLAFVLSCVILVGWKAPLLAEGFVVGVLVLWVALSIEDKEETE